MGNWCVQSQDPDQSQNIDLELAYKRRTAYAEAGSEAYSVNLFTKKNPSAEVVTNMQAIFRGYLARKLMRKARGASPNGVSTTSLSVRASPSMGEPLCKARRQQAAPSEDVPNYSNPATAITLHKYGAFVYDDDLNDGIEVVDRRPVILENGAVYTGQWSLSNKRHGRGKQVWPDCSVYEGYWVNDRAKGKGRLVHNDGDMYEGEWLDDKANGYGKYIHTDGATYVGSWLNDKQHGKGSEHWPDGSNFKGEYVDGLKEGRGKFTWPDGSRYEGEFEGNNIHGKGTYSWKDGRTYEGQWKANKMHGVGRFEWPDGRFYEGSYLHDKKHGNGVFRWPDGRMYEGKWYNGKQHGKGSFTKHGDTRKGEWVNGKRTSWA
jgi:hypothetical protein